jgi:alcohol dehydrogenase class IV
MAANVAVLHGQSAGAPGLRRYEEVARILTGRSEATIADGIRWAHALSADLGIPPLSQYGMVGADLPAVVAETQRASSTKGNPITLTDAALTEVLRQALHS